MDKKTLCLIAVASCSAAHHCLRVTPCASDPSLVHPHPWCYLRWRRTDYVLLDQARSVGMIPLPELPQVSYVTGTAFVIDVPVPVVVSVFHGSTQCLEN